MGIALGAAVLLQVPESDLDLDTLYHKLIQHNSQLQQMLENQRCSISPEISSSKVGAADEEGGTAAAGLYADLFRWYDKNANGAIEQDELQVGCLSMLCS